MPTPTPVRIVESKSFDDEAVLDLYRLNHWSSAEKPEELLKALQNSHGLVLAYMGDKLVGLGNAITDGHLVVYYPHMLVHPEYQGHGIGKLMMAKFQEKYGHLHMQMLTADGEAVAFYEACGFQRAGQTVPMWIYGGNEH